MADAWQYPYLRSEASRLLLSPQERRALVMRAEELQAVIEDAEAAARRGSHAAQAAAIAGADPGWPAPVREAWESYRQARIRAGFLDASERLEEAEPAGGGAVDAAYRQADDARYEAEAALERYSEARDEWQFGPQEPASVRDARDYYMEAQADAEYYARVSDRLREAGPAQAGGDASWEAHYARERADHAYERYSTAWIQWQFSLRIPGDHRDIEAGE